MIDAEKVSHKVKIIAENAESLFLMAKERFIETPEEMNSEKLKNKETMNSSTDQSKSGTKDSVLNSVSDKFNSQIVLALAEQIKSQFLDPFLSDYIKKYVDFHSKVEVKIKTLPHFKGNLPQYESDGASGLDVRAQIESPITIKPFERVLVPTGLSMEVPKEYEIQARPRSGLSLKKGLTLVNTPGTIDADYRGEIKMIMINLGKEDVVIEDQERIAQLVICPVVKAQFTLADDLSTTNRGEGGFGSTGTK